MNRRRVVGQAQATTHRVDDASMLNAGGQQWPPVFLSRQSNRLGVAALTCSLLLTAAAGSMASAAPVAASAGGYRLAGVIDAGGDNRTGFLELPRGGQVLIRLGTVIEGGGRVTEFSKRAVRIAFPDGRVVEFDLSGTGQPAAAQSGSHPVDIEPIVTFMDDKGGGLVRHVELTRFGKALSQQGATSDDFTKRLQGMLKLPIDARIVALNDAPIGATPAAIKKIQTLLAGNGIATLNLESPSGMQRVYVMRGKPAQP